MGTDYCSTLAVYILSLVGQFHSCRLFYTMPSPSSGRRLQSESLIDNENSPPLDVSTNPADLVKVLVSSVYILTISL